MATLAFASASASAQSTLAQDNRELLQQLQAVHGLQPAQMDKIRAIFAGSNIIGQGNPAITRHPLTPEQCKEQAHAQGVIFENPRFERICGAKYMAPLYNPQPQTA